MPSFSAKSAGKLATCDERLQRVFNEVVRHFDCTVLTGRRGETEQNEKFDQGLSTGRTETASISSEASFSA